MDGSAPLPKNRIDSALTEPCRGVVDIPDRSLGWQETSRLWGRDRASLGDCRKRHSALVKATGVLTK